MMKLIAQFARFAGIGFLNAAVDFSVLNFLAFLLGIFTGVGVGVINAISFTIANIHSYFWNKSWAFGKQSDELGFGRSLVQSIVAGVLGVIIIVLVLNGARLELAFWFYLVMLAVLLFGELILWKAFRIKRDSFGSSQGRQFTVFFVVSIGAVLLNSAIVAFGTDQIAPQFGLSQELWTNAIKVAANAIALLWNFVGYKLIVFKK